MNLPCVSLPLDFKNDWPAMILNSNCMSVLPINNLSHAGPSGTSLKHNSELSSITQSGCQMKKLSTLNGSEIMDVYSDTTESTSGCSSLNVHSDCSVQGRNNDGDATIFSKGLSNPRLDRQKLPNITLNSLNKRRLTFNAAVYSNSKQRSRSFCDGGVSSPFYTGRTIFGGSAVVDCITTLNRSSSSHNLSNIRSSLIQNRSPVRPIYKQTVSQHNSSYGMSVSSRKILEALEQFSSPIMEAKKSINTSTNNNDVNTPISRKRKLPSLDDTVLNTAELLMLKKKSRLQDSTIAARELAKSDDTFMVENSSTFDGIDTLNPTPITLDKVVSNQFDRRIETSELHTGSDVISDVNVRTLSATSRLEAKLPVKRQPFSFSTPFGAKSIDFQTSKSAANSNSSSDLKVVGGSATVISGKAINSSESLFLNRSPLQSADKKIFSTSEKSITDFKTNIPPKPILSFNKVRQPEKQPEITMTKEEEDEELESTTGNRQKTIMKTVEDNNKKNQQTYTSCRAVINKDDKDNTNRRLSNNNVVVADNRATFNSVLFSKSTEDDKWKCNNCWIFNEKSKMNCVACDASRSEESNSATATTVSLAVDSKSEKTVNSFGSINKSIFSTANIFNNKQSPSIIDTTSNNNNNNNIKTVGSGFKFTTSSNDSKPMFNFNNNNNVKISNIATSTTNTASGSTNSIFDQNKGIIDNSALSCVSSSNDNNSNEDVSRQNSNKTTSSGVINFSFPSSLKSDKAVTFNFQSTNQNAAVSSSSSNSTTTIVTPFHTFTVNTVAVSTTPVTATIDSGAGGFSNIFKSAINSNNNSFSSVEKPASFGDGLNKSIDASTQRKTDSSLPNGEHPCVKITNENYSTTSVSSSTSSTITDSSNCSAPTTTTENKIGGFSFPTRSEISKFPITFPTHPAYSTATTTVAGNIGNNTFSTAVSTATSQHSPNIFGNVNKMTSPFSNSSYLFNNPTTPTTNLSFNKSNDVVNPITTTVNSAATVNSFLTNSLSPFTTTMAITTTTGSVITSIATVNSKRNFFEPANFNANKNSSPPVISSTANAKTSNFTFGSFNQQQVPRQNAFHTNSTAVNDSIKHSSSSANIFSSSPMPGGFGNTTTPNIFNNSTNLKEHSAVKSTFGQNLFGDIQSRTPQNNLGNGTVAINKFGSTPNMFSNNTTNQTPTNFFGNTTNMFTFGTGNSTIQPEQQQVQQSTGSLFNPSVPATFNFTGGQQVTTFTAQPTSMQTNFARRFKRAVRRKP